MIVARRAGRAAVMLAALLSLPAAAELSGRDLLPMAREYLAVNDGTREPSYRSGFYAGYVRSAFERGNGRAFCGPPCACDTAEAVAAFLLAASPDLLERPALELVDRALAGSFRCGR